MRIDGVERWNQVRMCLVNQRTIRIDVPGRCIRVTYVDLGMARDGNRKRTQNWKALVEICEQHGYFKTRRFGGPVVTKKRVSRLNYALQDIFGIDESPFHPYRSDSGWRTRFQARPDVPDELSTDDDDSDEDDDA